MVAYVWCARPRGSLGEAPNHVVVAHSPRPQAAFGMTNHAFFLQHGRNGLAVADLLVGLIFLCKVDQATNGVALRKLNRLPCDYGLNRVGCIVVRRFIFLALVHLAVVYWAAVSDFQVLD